MIAIFPLYSDVLILVRPSRKKTLMARGTFWHKDQFFRKKLGNMIVVGDPLAIRLGLAKSSFFVVFVDCFEKWNKVNQNKKFKRS